MENRNDDILDCDFKSIQIVMFVRMYIYPAHHLDFFGGDPNFSEFLLKDLAEELSRELIHLSIVFDKSERAKNTPIMEPSIPADIPSRNEMMSKFSII